MFKLNIFDVINKNITELMNLFSNIVFSNDFNELTNFTRKRKRQIKIISK